MKCYIIFLFLIFSQSGFGQVRNIETFDSDPYYELEDLGIPKTDGKCGSSRIGVRFPSSPFGYNFNSSCATHDLCYDTCNAPKKICDDHFRGDMNGVCRDRFKKFDPRRYTCLGVAQTYWEAVNTLGKDAYRAAQVEACK